MIIDCHTHVNNYHDEQVDRLADCIANLRTAMRRNRVDAALVLTSYKVVPGRPPTRAVVDATRQYPDIQGSVFFRAENITRFSSKGFADSLRTDLYRYPALTPVMPWKDLRAPAVPHGLVSEWTGDEEVTLRWEPPRGEQPLL